MSNKDTRPFVIRLRVHGFDSFLGTDGEWIDDVRKYGVATFTTRREAYDFARPYFAADYPRVAWKPGNLNAVRFER